MDPLKLAREALKWAAPAQAKRIKEYLAKETRGRPSKVPSASAVAVDATVPSLTVKEAATYLDCTEVWVRRKFAEILKASTTSPKRIPLAVLEAYHVQ